jgi:hypothetical protein
MSLTFYLVQKIYRKAVPKFGMPELAASCGKIAILKGEFFRA